MSRCARFKHARWLPPAALSLLGLLLLSERLPAQVEFTECPNLVMRPRGGANWDGTHTFCPTVTQIDGRYYMWYTGVNGPLALGPEQANARTYFSASAAPRVADKPRAGSGSPTCGTPDCGLGHSLLLSRSRAPRVTGASVPRLRSLRVSSVAGHRIGRPHAGRRVGTSSTPGDVSPSAVRSSRLALGV